MVPIRSCIACRSRESSQELLHLVVVEDRVLPDPDRKLNGLGGRGAWLHPKCFELALQRRSFHRAFKSEAKLQFHELEIFLTAGFTKNKEQK